MPAALRASSAGGGSARSLSARGGGAHRGWLTARGGASSRPGSSLSPAASMREADGSLTLVSPGRILGNPVAHHFETEVVLPLLAGRNDAPTPESARNSGGGHGGSGSAFDPPAGLARVAAAGPASGELLRRTCQSRDLGHPCRGCGSPLTEVGSEIYIWKSPTFVKRFHPQCAAAFDGHWHDASTVALVSAAATAAASAVSGDAVPPLPSGDGGGGSAASTAKCPPRLQGAGSSSSLYADAWRRARLSDDAVHRAQERQAAREASMRWPRYPTAGMLWRAGGLALQQERRDHHNVTAWERQMEALRAFTKAAAAPPPNALPATPRAATQTAAATSRRGVSICGAAARRDLAGGGVRAEAPSPGAGAGAVDDPADCCAICLGDLSGQRPRILSSSRLGEGPSWPGSPSAEGLVDVSEEMLLLPCDPSHVFHARCLEPWLQKSFQCPLCRADLRPLLCLEGAQVMAESIAAGRRQLRRFTTG